ncbi:YcgL domain-containing protein [Marinobacter sp.]|uniref:YcgL domain-containing protein n=1 Tax=Marinobacter sp. TaxID=50741 RepID=UPI00384D0AC4
MTKDRQFISVFRSSKNSDTYAYVRRGQVWDELPETLQSAFGKPVHAMDLIMTPERKLAKVSGDKLLSAIEDQGFYLQMPERLDSYLVEFKQTLRQPSR